MTARNALHTPGKVVDATAARLSQAAGWAKYGLTPRTGIVYAGVSNLLTATASMTLNVAPFHFVASKADGQGVYVGANDGIFGLTIAAAPASGSRTDVVYVMQQDSLSPVSPDATTGAVIAATSGALPAGAVRIGSVVVPAGTTALTNAGVVVTTDCQWTTSAGAPIPVRNTTERAALTAYDGLTVYRLDTHVIESYNGASWGALGGSLQTYTPIITGVPVSSALGEYREVGGMVDVTVQAIVSGAATGTVTIPLPLVTRTYLSAHYTFGVAMVRDVSAGQYWMGQFANASGGAMSGANVYLPASSTNPLGTTLGVGSPLVLATGDTIVVHGRYARP